MSFDAFYEQKRKELGVSEGRHQRGMIYLGRQRRILGFSFGEPIIIGQVLEKPAPDGTGMFRVATTQTRGLVWDLAEAVEKHLGRDSEVVIVPGFPH